MIVEAIRNDPEWKNGDYEQQPHMFSRIVPMIPMLTGNPVRQYERYPTRAAADAYYEQLTKTVYQRVDTNDVLYRYDASSDYNPTPDLEKITARLLLIDFEDDEVNAPEFSVLDREMPRVKNGRYVIVPFGKLSDGEGNNIRNGELWKTHLEGFSPSLSPASTPWNKSTQPN
jgi:homoserine O-acetyltransferase/O-succinyltransferase